MFKKIIIVLLFVVLLLLGGLFVFINTFDLNKFLPQLTGQLSQALGRQVTVEKAGLQLSLKKGIVADIQGIALAEDAKFSKEYFINIGHIHCGVSLIALLTKRQVAVTSIVVQSPEVRLLRNEQGEFNYESLLKATKPSQAPAGSSAGSGEEKNASNAVMPELLVNSFEIRNAKIVLSDRAVKPALDVTVESIDAKVTNFSLSGPFKIELDASVFARGKNIHLDGTGRLDMALQQVRLDDLRLSFDLGLLEVARLNKDVAALGPVGLKEGLKGLLEVVINQMVVGPKGLLVLSMEGKFSGGSIPLAMLVKPIDQLNVKFDVNESRVKVSEYSLNLGSGRISGTADIKDYLTTQAFDVQTKVEGILIEDTIDQSKSPAKLKGSVSGGIQLSGQGFSEQAINTVLGKTQFTLTNGQLTNVNIIKSVLERIPLLSTLSQAAGSQLSEEIQTKVGGDLTMIDKATLKARVENASVLIDEAQLVSQKFSLLAQGQAGFDQTVDMQAELKMSKEFSQSMVESAGDMKALLDEQGEIRFPVKISGKVPNLTYMPDVAYISKLLIVNKGGGALQKVLDKNPEAKKFLDIFTGGDTQQEGDTGESAGQPAEDQEAHEESPGKQLLKGLLKGL